MRPRNDHCTEIHYIPLMAIIPRRDLYFAMKYWEHPNYRRVREGIEEEAQRTLYISNLPHRLFQPQLKKFLRGFNYLRCEWQPGDIYAILVFENLEEATRAYNELSGRKLSRSAVWLSWKIPNTIVYIMNINSRTPTTRIHKLLQGYRLYGSLVRRPHMMIAAFRNPEEAEIAVSRLQGTSVDGELLQFSILRGQHASEFVGYDRSLSCYLCLRTLRSGARTMSITATPPLALSLAVESPIYYELSFNLGENPQITLHDSRVLPAVTSHDIALRIRFAGHAAVERGPHGGANHFFRLMETFREDMASSGGIMDIGVVLEDPLDALKVENFFGESVPPASRVIPGTGEESQPYHGGTAGESSGIRESRKQRGNVLYSSAFNKPESSRRASVGSMSNPPPTRPGANGVPLGRGVHRKSNPHDSANTKGPEDERMLPIGLTEPQRPLLRYLPPNPGGTSGVSAFSDPQLKVRQFPFFSSQPTTSIMRPLVFGQRQPGSHVFSGGGENTLMGILKGSENNVKGHGDSEGIVEAIEGQEVNTLPEQMNGEGNRFFLPEAQINKKSSSDSASSSWSFLHRSYNSQAISSSSSASVGSVGESVTQAFGQMQYTDDSDSEATESAPAEIVDLTVDNNQKGRKSDKSGNLRRERRNIPIVDSSDDDGQSELESRSARSRRERAARRKRRSKRKEKVASDESMASENEEEQPVVERKRHKSRKKGKGKEIAHSDESMEFQSEQDEPGPSKPRKKSSKHKKSPKQVEPVSDYESPTPLKGKKKKKKKRAEEVEEVQEASDVDMDASDPPTKRTRKKRRGRQSSASESEDAIQPPIQGISETHVARGRSPSRHRQATTTTTTSATDPKTKKRKRSPTPSSSPTPTPIPSPPPANLSPSPARPGESMDAAFRRREIEKEIHRINLQQHELSVRESGLKHELKELRYQSRVEADVQGMTYANCVCSACGEYGHNRSNRGRCKRHPKYRDWYPDR
ncbi:hypothetical protein L873DRAFT_1773984 [Choiromyces venosus 120613-1]|uniref:RRM domain-containing protein n=1 Tax=Choiromyces venosus 120613-1 TaxID=1336337 RepID=A0A3N4JC45_9PEZI|nr:hypothetical protein L873DRAFT_1773984 [Choiromyces venosus 120613-1]